MLQPGFVLTDWLQVMTAVGSLLSGLALIGSMASIFLLLKQTRAVERTGVATAYQTIVAMNSEINQLFLRHPNLLEALLNPGPEDGWNLENERRNNLEVTMAAVQVLDFFEAALAVIPAFPAPLRTEWAEYIQSQLRRQRYLTRVVLATDWYTRELRQLATEAARR